MIVKGILLIIVLRFLCTLALTTDPLHEYCTVFEKCECQIRVQGHYNIYWALLKLEEKPIWFLDLECGKKLPTETLIFWL